VFFHPKSNSDQVFVRHLVEWGKILETYNLISFMRKTEKDGSFAIFKSRI
jgi:hypothetical protein